MIARILAAALIVAAPATSGGDSAVPADPLPGIRIDFPAGLGSAQAAQLREWLHATAGTVASVHGRFPADRLHIILRETRGDRWRSTRAVSFGQTTRRNGGTVELYVDPDRPIDEFYADWTAMHELSHLLLPLLRRSDRWISEGFASYYQNVLMARAGHYTADDAWRRLASGLQRGEDAVPGLSPAAAAERGVRDARMKYYWAGAALALRADVELRHRSGGRESLDSVLGKLHACCLPARRLWSGTGLFRRLDSFLDEPVFMPLYDRYAHAEGFPDYREALKSDELAPIRAEITRK